MVQQEAINQICCTVAKVSNFLLFDKSICLTVIAYSSEYYSFHCYHSSRVVLTLLAAHEGCHTQVIIIKSLANENMFWCKVHVSVYDFTHDGLLSSLT